MEMLGYRVLHSNVRGEVFNPNWEAELVHKTEGNIMRNTNDLPEGSTINERARDLYNNPR
jgi:regulatory protein YycI of two-component signal transduction system YycFG